MWYTLNQSYSIRCSDEIGLHIPGDSCLLRLSENHIGNWPEMEYLEPLAIAQHHGIPTRLLDFTYDGLIAAHFALTDAFEQLFKPDISENLDPTIDPCVVVWAFSIGEYWKKFQEWEYDKRRIQFVNVPSSSNMYLFKQKGVFLYDKYLNRSWHKDPSNRDELIKLNNALIDEIARLGLDESSVLQKVTLCKQEVLNALKILYQEGVTHAFLRPNFDWVVKTLKYEQWLVLNKLH